MTWLAQHLPTFLWALVATAVILVCFLWADWADRLEEAAKSKPKPPITAAEVEEFGESTVEHLEAYVNQEAEAARLFAEYANRPMAQRPRPDVTDPGEPWRLRRGAATDDQARLVELGDSDE